MSTRIESPLLLMTPIRALVVAATSLAISSAALAQETLVQYLSGHGPEDAVPWDFFCTAGRNSGTWSKIRVPSCWEQEGFGTYYYGVWRRGKPDDDPEIPREQGKYRTEFDVPATWQGRVVRIVFEGAMTDTDVRINGQSAGAIHQGGFYEFRYDITSLLKFGAKNLLEVTVSKESSNVSVNRAERRGDYWTFGGIFRPVWLEALPQQFIDWTAIDARADGSFRAEVHLSKPTTQPLIPVTAEVWGPETKPIGEPIKFHLVEGATSVVLTTKFEGVKSWTAETPIQYHVVFTMGDSHRISRRFGFRTFEVRPRDGLYLNGTKITLKGINRHCFWPETGRTLSREQSYADARLIKEANMNAVRMSHYPPDAHFLEACDELGLYVLDELAGWQGSYDTPTGARLIGQIVRRDVNHPSILFWDNGNEGGWNTANDGEFAKWDPQKRPVLHPWVVFSDVNTDHYEKYDSTVKLSAGPDIFMPTEFLHGLYDGGIGAGFRDYWDVMGKSPLCAGGFFWVFADEGIVRTDQKGRIDNAGNLAPDGIVGPHHEKEGSFFAVKEIWSPVQITAPSYERAPGETWDGTLTVENGYDFTNLDRCTVEWSVIRCPVPSVPESKYTVVARGSMRGPNVGPHKSGPLRVPMQREWIIDATALLVSVKGPSGEPVLTWSLPCGGGMRVIADIWGGKKVAQTRETAREVIASLESLTFRFNKATGQLIDVANGRQKFSLSGGRFVAFKRNDRAFVPVANESKLLSLTAQSSARIASVEAKFSGALSRLEWEIDADNGVRVEYEYDASFDADIVGIVFDYPEANVKSKRWLGRGPYRVYRNRMEGGVFDVHELAYNDPIPGQTYASPEFKGYFRDWQWITLTSTEGNITISVDSRIPFLGLYAPRDGEPPMMPFPDTGIAFLDVIPAQGSKFATPDTTGPQGQTPHVSGVKRGSVVFRFDPK